MPLPWAQVSYRGLGAHGPSDPQRKESAQGAGMGKGMEGPQAGEERPAWGKDMCKAVGWG